MLTLSSKIFPSNLENCNFNLVHYFLTAFFFSKQPAVLLPWQQIRLYEHP